VHADKIGPESGGREGGEDQVEAARTSISPGNEGERKKKEKEVSIRAMHIA
jgi:hypothetical protein